MKRHAWIRGVLLILLSLLLCSCNNTQEPKDDPTEDDNPMNSAVDFPIAPTDGAYRYTVFRNEDCSQAERNALVAVRAALDTVYGSSPTPETNYSTEDLSDEQIAARFEILIGKTGRVESEQAYASLSEGEYTIRLIGNKLVVLGKSDELTVLAVKLLEKAIRSAPATLGAGYADTLTYTPGNYTGSYDFAALGCTKLTDVKFEYRDSENDDEILYVTCDNYHYTFGYYSNNSWTGEDILIAARSASDNAIDFGKAELVALDIESEEAWLLPVTAGSYTEYVVDSELIYYVVNKSELRCYNLLTGTDRTVYTKSGLNFPHITANGSHINLSVHYDGLDHGLVVDVKTGESYEIMAVRFEEPYPVANHHMICPTDPTMMFFAHEGTTQDIPDRLWIAKRGEEPYNIAYQNVAANGKPLDCFGHECWAPDGKGLYFVKYSVSPSAPKGVCYVSLDDIENPQVLYSKFPYWHVSCSPDERYLASDTQSGAYSGVCLIDTETDEEILIYKAQTYKQTHPGHPHPCFNTESNVLCFNDHNLENGRVSIGIYMIP